MAKMAKSEKVPKALQETFDRIVAITDNFSEEYLNNEYAELIRLATAALCRKRPSPLSSGRGKTWACGITHAIGMVNFLYDSSQTPHISVKELYQWFGISASTGQAKSKVVRDTLGMNQLNTEWFLPSRVDDHPLTWMVMVNGFIVDVRSMPREVQEIAYAQGMIPYIPGEKPGEEVFEETDSSVTQTNVSHTSSDSLFVLEVSLVGGLITEEFNASSPGTASGA